MIYFPRPECCRSCPALKLPAELWDYSTTVNGLLKYHQSDKVSSPHTLCSWRNVLPLAKNLLLYFKGSFFYSSKATSECIHSSTLQHAAKWSSLLTQTLCTRWDTHRETFPTNSHLPWSPSFQTAWMWTLTVHQPVRVFFFFNKL